MCGGTGPTDDQQFEVWGLSPRVRGNLSDVFAQHGPRGSIPACAGEPLSIIRRPRTGKVYPRVCGGTSLVPSRVRTITGLSPRVRGNRASRQAQRQPQGSIPACAGEPSNWRPKTSGARVYPRVCGGTRRLAVVVQRQEGLSPRVRGNPQQVDERSR